MKPFVYKGKKGLLGRFGYVRRGDIIQLNHAEARSVEGNPEFSPKETDTENLNPVLLQGATAYDLRTIPWERGSVGLSKWLSKCSGRTLRKIISAIEEIGGAPADEPFLRFAGVHALVDYIVDFAQDNSWLNTDTESRLAMPSADKTEETPETEDVDESNDPEDPDGSEGNGADVGSVEAISAEELEGYTKVELTEMCDKLGILTKGSKSTLIGLLVEHAAKA